MKNTDIPYELIAKYFRNECDSNELYLLESWRQTSDIHETILEDLRNEWLLIQDKKEVAVFPDKNTVWEKISDRIQPVKMITQTYSRHFIWRVAGLAASVALLFGIATTFIIQKNVQNKLQSEQITVISTPPGQKTQMTLPDGTQVWLNSGSKISYSANFNNRLREVSLEGEAFFDVKRNPEKKFIVSTNDIKVTVLGTAFDVMAYPQDDQISVSLQRGKVALSSNTDAYYGELLPNQLAVISKKDMKCTWYDHNDAETFSTWTQNRLVFYNSDIHDVIAKLERWYGIKIKFSNPDESQKYTFAVKTESVHELLDLFNKITPVNYKIEGEEVTISRK